MNINENLQVRKNGRVVGSLRWTPDSLREGWLMRRLARRGYFGVSVWFEPGSYPQIEGRGWYYTDSTFRTSFIPVRPVFLGRNIRQARAAIDAMTDRTVADTTPELANA